LYLAPPVSEPSNNDSRIVKTPRPTAPSSRIHKPICAVHWTCSPSNSVFHLSTSPPAGVTYVAEGRAPSAAGAEPAAAKAGSARPPSAWSRSGSRHSAATISLTTRRGADAGDEIGPSSRSTSATTIRAICGCNRHTPFGAIAKSPGWNARPVAKRSTARSARGRRGSHRSSVNGDLGAIFERGGPCRKPGSRFSPAAVAAIPTRLSSKA
jgi:hypothetical protein